MVDNKNNKGFTLIELILTTALTAIIASVSYYTYKNVALDKNVLNETKNLKTLITTLENNGITNGFNDINNSLLENMGIDIKGHLTNPPVFSGVDNKTFKITYDNLQAKECVNLVNSISNQFGSIYKVTSNINGTTINNSANLVNDITNNCLDSNQVSFTIENTSGQTVIAAVEQHVNPLHNNPVTWPTYDNTSIVTPAATKPNVNIPTKQTTNTILVGKYEPTAPDLVKTLPENISFNPQRPNPSNLGTPSKNPVPPTSFSSQNPPSIVNPPPALDSNPTGGSGSGGGNITLSPTNTWANNFHGQFRTYIANSLDVLITITPNGNVSGSGYNEWCAHITIPKLSAPPVNHSCSHLSGYRYIYANITITGTTYYDGEFNTMWTTDVTGDGSSKTTNPLQARGAADGQSISGSYLNSTDSHFSFIAHKVN